MVTKIKMEQVQNDIDVQADNSVKNTNLIEWNVDMKVTVSNVKKSKMFQRSRSIVLFLLAIIFAVILSHLRKEVRGLQVQMQCINVNLLLLMSKYDRLNRNLNRVWIHRPEKFLENSNVRDAKGLLEGASSSSKVTEILDSIRRATNGNSFAYNSIVPYLNPKKNLKDKYLLSNDVSVVNKGNDYTVPEPFTKLEEGDKIRDNANSRIERAIVMFENKNSTEKSAQSSQGKIESNNDDDYVDDDVDMWREPRSGRWRRDEGRGKKRGKNKRRPKRSRRRLGI